MRKILGLTIVGASLLTGVPAYAHCPLCTAAAGTAAGLAATIGVKFGAIGVFMGGFATALGLWIGRLVKKRYLPRQNLVLFWAVYLSTLLPLIPFMKDYTSWYIFWRGDYGSIFNRTYLINLFLVGALLGSFIVYGGPRLSALLTRLRGGMMFKYQGIIITNALLVMAAILMQVLRR